jgi:hypothetical protein
MNDTVIDPRLGRHIHRAQASALVAWLIFSVGMVILLAWAGLSAAFAIDQRSRAMPGDGWWIGPLVMAFFFVPFGLIFAVKGYRGRVLRFDLYDGGFAFEDRNGRVSLPWDEIGSVFWEGLSHIAKLGFGVDVTTHGSAKVTILSMRQKPIVVDERFPDHVKLCAMVRDAAAAAMLPRIEAAIVAGQPVFFGPVGVSREGFSLGHIRLSWNAVGSVRWESSRELAWYALYDSNGAFVTKVDAAVVSNEVIFRVVLGRLGKLGVSEGQASPLGDEILATARRFLAR